MARTLSEIREALASCRFDIEKAAKESGRSACDISLCAVCKMQPTDTVRQSAALDIDLFGENHMQELVVNHDSGAYCGKPVHFIGHLQTNKVKKVVGRASLIQSVDSIRLLEAIEKECSARAFVQDILFEINIGGEKSKTGADAELLPNLLETAAALKNIRVRGLMTVPPICLSDEYRRYFAQMRRLFDDIAAQKIENCRFDILSMGMSGSFREAIAEGSTLVRIGSAIFGPRNYNK